MVSYSVLGAAAFIAFFFGVIAARRYPDRKVIWEAPRSNVAHDSAIEDPQLIAMLQQGKVIDAIKRYRELTGAGLKDSKDAVEQLKRQSLKS